MTKREDLDARGLLCPLPVLKARKTLANMADGAVLHMIADDPVAVIDVPHFCQEAGYNLLECRDVENAQLYVIQKPLN